MMPPCDDAWIYARRSRVSQDQASISDQEERSEEHTSELQSPDHLVCRLLLEKKKKEQFLPRLGSRQSGPLRPRRSRIPSSRPPATAPHLPTLPPPSSLPHRTPTPPSQAHTAP